MPRFAFRVGVLPSTLVYVTLGPISRLHVGRLMLARAKRDPSQKSILFQFSSQTEKNVPSLLFLIEDLAVV